MNKQIELPIAVRLATNINKAWPLNISMALSSPLWLFIAFNQGIFNAPEAWIRIGFSLFLTACLVAPAVSVVALALLRRDVPQRYMEALIASDELAGLLRRRTLPMNWLDLTRGLKVVGALRKEASTNK